ncbi:hypothetical protein D3C79_604430 [compost metagenome]
MAQRRYTKATGRPAFPPHHQPAHRTQQNHQAHQQNDDLVQHAEHLALVQHHAQLGSPGDRAVVLPAHVGQHLAGVLIDMQGGIVARVVGEHGDGVHAFGGGGQGNAVARLDCAGGGQVLDLLQADLRGCGCTGAHVMPGMFGVGTRFWHRCVFHRPGHGLATGTVQLACLLVGLGDIRPHRCRKAVPYLGILLAPETGPGHAAEQHQQQ